MPSHRNAIHTAMQTLAANPPHLRSLTSFYHVVQDREIKEAIQHYTTQGAMGRLLDADSDSLNLSRFMTFEIEDLMNLGDKNLVRRRPPAKSSPVSSSNMPPSSSTMS